MAPFLSLLKTSSKAALPKLRTLLRKFFPTEVIRITYKMKTPFPRYFQLKTISLGFALQLFTIRYFELPLFKTIFCFS